MKTLLVLASFFALQSFGYAAGELKITSFGRISNNTQNMAAEVCGTLTGLPAGPHMIHLTTDYTTDQPGHYYTWVGQANAFCAVVTTYRGVVQADVEGSTVNLVRQNNFLP